MSTTVRVVVRTNPDDYNSGMEIPCSSWIRWASLARNLSFRHGPLRKLVLSGAVVMVKSQAVRLLMRDTVKMDSVITIEQSYYALGKTSCTLAYLFTLRDGRIVARGYAGMVAVRNGAVSPMPPFMATEGDWQIAPSKSNGLPAELAAAAAALDRSRASLAHARDVLTRPSDESKLHVTHWRYVQFFEDAIVTLKRGVPDFFYIECVEGCDGVRSLLTHQVSSASPPRHRVQCGHQSRVRPERASHGPHHQARRRPACHSRAGQMGGLL